MPVNQLDLIYMEASTEEQLEEQREVILARRYHEGNHDIYLNARAREFLGLHAENPFRLNVCRGVVMALLDELKVIGFDTGEPGDKKPLSEWALKVWDSNKMDAIQKDVHETALRDRESFIIVDWDDINSRPRLNWHQRYTSLAAHEDGDEVGCYMLYPDDDYTQPPRAAVHQWMETLYDTVALTQRQRRTIYYPNRIERYFYSAGWEKYVDNPDDEWPIWWTDNGKESGKGLGIPVIHFKNAGLRPEAWDAIPIQDAINKTLIDILAAGDMTAFRVFVALGFIPTSDGLPLKADQSNIATIAPGQIIGTTKTDAKFVAIDGADPTPLVNTLVQLILFAAMVTDTPTSRFMASRQAISGESAKEQSAPLRSKAETRRTGFGNAWEDVMSMARKLANLFGNAGFDEELSFSTLWKHTYSLDELKTKKDLGVPQEQIWKEMGYTQVEIVAMKNMDEYKSKQDAMNASMNASRALIPGEAAMMNLQKANQKQGDQNVS